MTNDVHNSAHKMLSPFSATYHTKLITFPNFVRREGIFMFSMVRHPFERLVSAYEDKILNHGPGREKHFELIAEQIGTDFGAFANFVIEDARERGCNDFGCDVNIHYRPYFVR